MFNITRPVIGIFLATMPFIALADIPPLDESWISTAYDGPLTMSLLTIPNGTGNPLTQVYLPGGNSVDGTITLHLMDHSCNPVANYPLEDIWLAATDDGLIACIGGTNPESDTNPEGVTSWTSPLLAGGYSMDYINVCINGSFLNNTPGIDMFTNSPDINGDLVVNLADLSMLAADFFNSSQPYHYRSDFYFDGVINLADLGIFAAAMGTQCP